MLRVRPTGLMFRKNVTFQLSMILLVVIVSYAMNVSLVRRPALAAGTPQLLDWNALPPLCMCGINPTL